MLQMLRQSALGPALAIYRYYQSRAEIGKTKPVEETLSDRHLRNLKAFPSRRAMIETFPRNGVVVEVGVAAGAFSQEIWDATQPSRLHLIDLWRTGSRASGKAISGGKAKNRQSRLNDLDRVKDRFAQQIEDGNVRIHQGLSWDMILELEDESVDWTYIDAAHDYESVKKDLHAILPKIRPNGIISGHDYVRWGRFGYKGGVIEAVHSFCRDNDFEFIGLTFDSKYPPSYAIRRIAA